jgi:hypothetical protein
MEEESSPLLYPNSITVNEQGHVAPSLDNAYSLGTSDARWAGIWTETHPITSADQSQLANVQDCHLGTSFIRALRPISYQFVIGANAIALENDETVVVNRPGQRTHCGFSAQQVHLALQGADFGGWISVDPTDPNAIQALRYEQLIAPLVKALQEALDRIDALEAAINA